MKHVFFAVVLLLLIAQPTIARQGRDTRRAPVGHDVLTKRNLVYAKVDPSKQPLKLDLYLPGASASTKKPRPVVVWIHGGGWRSGNKWPWPLAWLTRDGYAVASVQYRLSGEAPWPAQIQDCRAAIRWLRANAKTYHLDPHRFAAAGASAGGHLVAMLGTAADLKGIDPPGAAPVDPSPAVQAVVDFFGPTDLAALPVPPNDRRNAVALLLGGSLREKSELARQASPLIHVSADDPPFLIIHGDRDRLVPLAQSRALHEALKKAGVSSTLHIIKGAGHGLGMLRKEPTLPKRVRDFLDEQLHTVTAH